MAGRPTPTPLALQAERLEGRSEYFAGFGVLALMGGIGAGLCVLGLQGFYWLRDAVWPEWPVGRALESEHIQKPITQWLGAQKVIDLLWQTPLSVTVFVAGMILGFGALAHSSSLAEQARGLRFQDRLRSREAVQ